MRFDAMLESKVLPTYRSMILRAVEAGHHIDLLYHAAKSLCESDLLDTHPAMMLSVSFAEPLDMSLEQAMRNAATTQLSGAYYQPIAMGWRLWTTSSEDFQVTEITQNEIALLSSVRVAQKCFHVEHFLMWLARIFKFSENAGRPDFSFLLFVQGLQGLSIIRNGIRQPNGLTDDNIVVFYQNCSCPMLTEICLRSLRGFGEVASNRQIERLIYGAQ